MSGRLQRGRSYARRGQVLEFSLAAGKVAARVQGSRPTPYKVTIAVRPLTAAQWQEVESRLAAQALFRARLLAGEMPAEIEQVFADAGTPLFPESSRDLTMDCNCPDWGFPCKHVAAVCYVLAEAFDDDPFAMLAWRGKSRDELLAALRGMGASRTAGGAAERRRRPCASGRPGWSCRPGQPRPGGAVGRDRPAAGGVARGFLVARPQPGPAARHPAQPGHTARPAAPPVRAAPGPGPRSAAPRSSHPGLHRAHGGAGRVVSVLRRHSLVDGAEVGSAPVLADEPACLREHAALSVLHVDRPEPDPCRWRRRARRRSSRGPRDGSTGVRDRARASAGGPTGARCGGGTRRRRRRRRCSGSASATRRLAPARRRAAARSTRRSRHRDRTGTRVRPCHPLSPPVVTAGAAR